MQINAYQKGTKINVEVIEFHILIRAQCDILLNCAL